jgi:hypothetical protein
MPDGIYEIISTSDFPSLQVKKEIKFNKNYRKKLASMAAIGFNCCTECVDLFKIFDFDNGKHFIFRGFPFDIKAAILPRRLFSSNEFDKIDRNFKIIKNNLLDNFNSNFRIWKNLYFNEHYRNILNNITDNIWSSDINLKSFHGGVDTFSRIYSQLAEIADLHFGQRSSFCLTDDPEQVNKPTRGFYNQLFLFTLGPNNSRQEVFAEIATNFRQLEVEFYSKDTLRCLGLPLNIKINVFDIYKDLNCYMLQFLIEDFVVYYDGGPVTWKSKDHLSYLLKKLFFITTFINIIKKANKN